MCLGCERRLAGGFLRLAGGFLRFQQAVGGARRDNAIGQRLRCRRRQRRKVQLPVVWQRGGDGPAGPHHHLQRNTTTSAPVRC